MHAARSLTAAVRAAGPAAGVAKSVASGLRAGAAAVPSRNVYLKKHEQDQDVKSFTMVSIGSCDYHTVCEMSVWQIIGVPDAYIRAAAPVLVVEVSPSIAHTFG